MPGSPKRLSDFAYSILGWIRGGMAMSALGGLRVVRRHLGVELGDDGDDRLHHAPGDDQDRL